VKYEISMGEDLFRKKIVRDLQSLVTQPLILDTPGTLTLQREMCDKITHFIDNGAERLDQLLVPPDPRLPLGKWFEKIFFAALRITHPLAEVHHSVSDGCGGELDFVVVNAENTTHIECAVKFFVHHRSLGSGMNAYLGPGGNDRLDLKFEKMSNVQLKRTIPFHLHSGRGVERVLWMSGRIHEPVAWNPDGVQCLSVERVPFPMNPDAVKGYWGTLRQVSVGMGGGEVLYKLPRQWRMTSVDGLRRADLSAFRVLSFDEAVLEPMMTVRVSYDGEFAVELGRGFVVPG
jgi:Domain of unknown function (DUF1853)